MKKYKEETKKDKDKAKSFETKKEIKIDTLDSKDFHENDNNPVDLHITHEQMMIAATGSDDLNLYQETMSYIQKHNHTCTECRKEYERFMNNFTVLENFTKMNPTFIELMHYEKDYSEYLKTQFENWRANNFRHLEPVIISNLDNLQFGKLNNRWALFGVDNATELKNHKTIQSKIKDQFISFTKDDNSVKIKLDDTSNSHLIAVYALPTKEGKIPRLVMFSKFNNEKIIPLKDLEKDREYLVLIPN